MARAEIRHVAVFTGVSVVALGALALLGLGHPHAPTGALHAYLPQITLPTVIVAAALDGINPCAFTVLLLLITAMLATAQSRASSVAELRTRMLARGGLFVGVVFLTYLALGLGLIGTMAVITRQHWPARIGALVAVFLGLWMMKDYFLPDTGWQLHAPPRVAEVARTAAKRGTVPALLIGGFLIGLGTVSTKPRRRRVPSRRRRVSRSRWL